MDHSENNIPKLLVDTNIILDVIFQRQPFYENSRKIFDLCCSEKVKGYLAFHTIPTIWYLMRRSGTDQMCRDFINSLLVFFDIPQTDKNQIQAAISRKDFSDFEDCLQDESAVCVNAGYIITRNKKDFSASKTTALLPEEFLKLLNL